MPPDHPLPDSNLVCSSGLDWDGQRARSADISTSFPAISRPICCSSRAGNRACRLDHVLGEERLCEPENSLGQELDDSRSTIDGAGERLPHPAQLGEREIARLLQAGVHQGGEIFQSVPVRPSSRRPHRLLPGKAQCWRAAALPLEPRRGVAARKPGSHPDMIASLGLREDVASRDFNEGARQCR